MELVKHEIIYKELVIGHFWKSSLKKYLLKFIFKFISYLIPFIKDII